QFELCSQVKGLENVVRYGLVTWIPLYYFEASGLELKSTLLATQAIPLGYVLAPFCAGWFSDYVPQSPSRPMVLLSVAVSALALVGIAVLPPKDVYVGATLLFIGSFAMSLSPMAAMAVDIAGRRTLRV